MSTGATRAYFGGRWHELKSPRIELRPPARTTMPLPVRLSDPSITGTFQQRVIPPLTWVGHGARLISPQEAIALAIRAAQSFVVVAPSEADHRFLAALGIRWPDRE